MEYENSKSAPNVSIPADEYFSYKMEKVQQLAEEKVRSQFRKSQFISVVVISVVLGAFGSYFTGLVSERLSYVEYISERSKKSDYLLEESLVKLDRASKEAALSQEVLSILKKEVLALKLEIEKIKTKLEASSHRHEVDGKQTSESRL